MFKNSAVLFSFYTCFETPCTFTIAGILAETASISRKNIDDYAFYLNIPEKTTRPAIAAHIEGMAPENVEPLWQEFISKSLF